MDIDGFLAGQTVCHRMTNVTNLILAYMFGKVTQTPAQFLSDDNLGFMEDEGGISIKSVDLVSVGLGGPLVDEDLNGLKVVKCLCGNQAKFC